MATCRQRLPGAPDLLALHAHDPARYPALIDSAAAHRIAGRYDILFALPRQRLSARHDDAAAVATIFNALDRIPLSGDGDEPLPFIGGWFFYLGYEMAGHFEPALRLPASPHQLPDLIALECPAAVIHDRADDCTWLVAEDAVGLDRLRADLAAAPPLPPRAASGGPWREAPAAEFVAAVDRVRDYLLAGDAFQVNLSRAWDGQPLPAQPAWQLYRQLRDANPAPFAGLLHWQDSALLSSSPERLVRVERGQVETRPIAGTRRRDGDPDADARLRAELLASRKERAEHIMLIDLERNDLGRICVPGSIRVDELMGLESYATVHHIVSNIVGRLRPEIRTSQLLRAVFPGGTITGCPKVRVMQIIAELEGEGRGPYTGSLGYLSRHGRLDSNILIRSLIVEGGAARLRAGAGIVVDSVAEAELAETRVKAAGLLRAFTPAP